MLSNEIVQKYQEFQEFLKSIPLEEMAKNMSRVELKELEDSIRSCDLRSVSYEISQIRKAKKEEEYPQLLHVHHYPEILQFSFLSKNEMKKLDEFLVKHHVGDYIMAIYKAISGEEKQKQTLDALVEHHIIEETHHIRCPQCSSGRITRGIDKETYQLVTDILSSQDDERLEEIEEHLLYYCGHCDEETEVYELMEMANANSLESKVEHKLIKERDTSLDYV